MVNVRQSSDRLLFQTIPVRRLKLLG
jgi:hypothetical protein